MPNKNMKALKVKPIKVPSSYVHPNPPNEALPRFYFYFDFRHEFTLGLIGKSFLFFVFIIPICILLLGAPAKI